MSQSHSPLSEKALELRRTFDRSFAEERWPGEVVGEDLLALRVGPDPYALRLREIRGLFADKKIVALPGPVPTLLGVAGFRGVLAPVYNLGALLDYGVSAPPRWLVMLSGAHPVALAFDAFEGHLRMPPAAFARHHGTGPASRHVREVVRCNGATRPVLHLPSVLEVIKDLASRDALKKKE